MEEKIVLRPIEEEMRGAYIDYAMSVIVSRALPDVRDGLKPVQRRVLYGMYELGLTYDKPHKKSARIIGEVLGKYHPHGDASVYDTLVRLAQPWSLRYPLVDGQGNFGSIDGDSAAAMRYTEARLERIADEMLRDMEKETVDFIPNFDDSLYEPQVLPALLPNLLVNGATGIAVGMATSMPPHNLTEVAKAIQAYIDNPDISIDQLMEYLPGPDFPTGGVIMGTEGIRQAYETGKGKIILRGRAYIDTAKSGRDQIIISEIPYLVNKAALVTKIAQLASEKKLEDIVQVRDESDREGLRIVVELRREAKPKAILNALYLHTPLETAFHINMVALHKGRPRQLGLKDLIAAYVDHRNEVIYRRTQYELQQAQKRAHIVEGLLIALDQLDAVIALIRGSQSVDQARQGLISQFQLSVQQAQAILDMRLQRLTALEREKLHQEYQELLEKIAYYKQVLADPQLQRDIIKKELTELIATYGDPRRTQILAQTSDIGLEDTIPNLDTVVFISHRGYVKRTSFQEYRKQGRGGVGVRAMDIRTDDYIEHLFTAKLHDFLLLFTQKGMCYWVKVHELPEGGRSQRGRAIQNLISLSSDDKVVAYLNVSSLQDPAYIEAHTLFMVTRQGMVKRTPLSEFSRPRSNGIIALHLREGDMLVGVALIDREDREVIVVSQGGMGIRFLVGEVRSMGRNAVGVKGMELEAHDGVVSMGVIRAEGQYLLTVTENGYGKATPLSEYRVTHRGGKGVRVMLLTDKTGPLVAALVSELQGDKMLVTKEGQSIRISAQEIPILGRAAQGNRLMRLRAEDKLACITPLYEEEPSDGT
ncbi:MAG: DNA gyrase subunit A [Bacteroidia bacterium]